MTLLQVIFIQANIWFLAFCIMMPSLGKTATDIAQLTSILAGGSLLTWAFFGFVGARELTADAAFNTRCFYAGAAMVTLASLLIVWKPWKTKS